MGIKISTQNWRFQPQKIFNLTDENDKEEFTKYLKKASREVPTDKEEFEAYLKANPNARLLIEHCDTAEEVREMEKILRSVGSVHSSKGFSNLISAIIDEAKLANKDLLANENKVGNKFRLSP